jgi:hypothetical protein
MSTFSKPFFQLRGGIRVAPTGDNGVFASAARPVQLAAERASSDPGDAGYVARILMGVGTEDATMYPNGSIAVSEDGTRQIETLTVVAAGGATASGNLVVTVTKTGLPGSPLAINVPLTTAAHTTAALIATAIAEKLNATAVVAAFVEVTADGAGLSVRSIYPTANDVAFNVAITGALGVTAVASSTNAVAGVNGVIVERMGLDGTDLFGITYPDHEKINSIYISVPPESIGGATVLGGPMLLPGSALGMDIPYGSIAVSVESTEIPSIVEVLVLTK